MTKPTAIDDALRIARDVQPDLWKRTEGVARLIDPAAFATDWVIHPPELAELHALRLKVMQGTAMTKAHDILRYLGVNTDTDWFLILTRLAEESSAAARRGEAE